jgi:hypothetical protein
VSTVDPDPVLQTREVSAAWFVDPPQRYRPSATVRVGDVPAEAVADVLQAAIDEGFGSLMLFPSANRPASTATESRDPTMARVRRSVVKAEVEAWLAEMGEPDPPHPARSPVEYLGEEYFRRYVAALDFGATHGMTAILYDELDYPSGYAGGARIDPQHYRKLLARTTYDTFPEAPVPLPAGQLLAAVAVHAETKERLGLTRMMTAPSDWASPGPGWALQLFSLVTSEPQGGPQDYHAVVDYFDPAAVQQFIDVTYESYARHVGPHLGTTITTTFFDDVGIYSAERT